MQRYRLRILKGRNYVFEEESVYLLTDTITIPAGESVTVEFDYRKHGNHQTHVLVNDPEKGYGIFLESMLNHGN